MLINNQKELKHIIIHLALVYKYLKKYNKINMIKNIIKVDPKSESFVKSINIINIKDLFDIIFNENKNLGNTNIKKNRDINNIQPFIDDTLKSVENKDSYISNIIKYKESKNNTENSIVEYKINKKNILNKINSNKKHK